MLLFFLIYHNVKTFPIHPEINVNFIVFARFFIDFIWILHVTEKLERMSQQCRKIL
jgi:hypothetical protein